MSCAWDAATKPRMLKTAETISVRMAVSSIIRQNTPATKIPRAGPIMQRSALFERRRRPGAGLHTLSLRGKNPAGPVARAGCMTQRLNWVKNGPDALEMGCLYYRGGLNRSTQHFI